jgi:hypothetical protein
MKVLAWLIDFFWRHFVHPDMAGLSSSFDGHTMSAMTLFSAALFATAVGALVCVVLVAWRVGVLVRN